MPEWSEKQLWTDSDNKHWYTGVDPVEKSRNYFAFFSYWDKSKRNRQQHEHENYFQDMENLVKLDSQDTDTHFSLSFSICTFHFFSRKKKVSCSYFHLLIGFFKESQTLQTHTLTHIHTHRWEEKKRLHSWLLEAWRIPRIYEQPATHTHTCMHALLSIDDD